MSHFLQQSHTYELSIEHISLQGLFLSKPLHISKTSKQKKNICFSYHKTMKKVTSEGNFLKYAECGKEKVSHKTVGKNKHIKYAGS